MSVNPKDFGHKIVTFLGKLENYIIKKNIIAEAMFQLQN
jgi:hypothetical protein